MGVQQTLDEAGVNNKRLCSLAQLRRASPTPIRQIAQLLGIFVVCRGICMARIFAVSDAFFDAVVSAWMRYLLLQMLFSCQSCIIASAIYLFHDLQILISEKRYPQFTYSKTCRCQPPQNCICNLLISNLADTSNTSSFT